MKTIQRGETSLFAAVMNQNEGNEAVVKYLVEHDADINKKCRCKFIRKELFNTTTQFDFFT